MHFSILSPVSLSKNAPEKTTVPGREPLARVGLCLWPELPPLVDDVMLPGDDRAEASFHRAFGDDVFVKAIEATQARQDLRERSAGGCEQDGNERASLMPIIYLSVEVSIFAREPESAHVDEHVPSKRSHIR